MDAVRLELQFNCLPGIVFFDLYVVIEHLVFSVLNVDRVISLVGPLVVDQFTFSPSITAFEWLHKITKK